MSQLNSEFIIELAKSCIVSKNILEIVKAHLQYSYLNSEPEKQIFKYIFDFHSANNKTPTVGLISQHVNSRDATSIIAKIAECNIYDKKDTILETFEEYIRRAKFIELHKGSEELFARGEYDKAYVEAKDGYKELHEFSLKRKQYSKIYEQFDKRQYERQNRDFSTTKIPTGLPAFDHLTHGGIDAGTGLLVVARSGSGKAQPLYSKIYTPDGFTTMGEIKVGDSVLSEKGETIKVIGVFPQGIRDVYRIHFSDGVYVDCDENHLWKVYTANDRKRVADSKRYASTFIDPDRHTILNTKEMIGKERIFMCRDRENVLNYKLPICKPINFNKKELPIPPYTMGALIGDGHFFETPTISTIDKEILERVGNELQIKPIHIDKCSYRLSYCKLGSRLRKLFGREIHSYDKFIPCNYLYSSLDDRVNLLRGLMDTDGSLSGEGTCSIFHTSSFKLAEDVRELVNGLGGTGHIVNRGYKKYTYRGEKRISKRLAYDVMINLPNEINPFFLKRKAIRVVPKTSYLTPRFIDKIEYVGKMQTQCIAVDNSTSLYLTDHCIVTHNTTLLRSLGFHASFRGIPVLHLASGDSTKEEIENGYDAMWTGVQVHDIRRGDLSGADIKKIEKAKQAYLAQAGEIYVHVFEQFHNASILDCRNILIDLLKEAPIGLVLFDLLEGFDPGDGKRYSTGQDGTSTRKKATSEKIINIATEFKIGVAAVTQASDIKKEFWNNPNWVITRNDISNLKATLDPFAYALTLNQTEDEYDNSVMRLHIEKKRHYRIESWQSTFSIAQDVAKGRFIDVAETNKKFWDVEKKQIIRNKPLKSDEKPLDKTRRPVT